MYKGRFLRSSEIKTFSWKQIELIHEFLLALRGSLDYGFLVNIVKSGHWCFHWYHIPKKSREERNNNPQKALGIGCVLFSIRHE
jgi:hypothetical protein